MPSPFTAGAVFAGYRITERIDDGGMGVVFRAEDVNLGRPVALKVIGDEASDDESFRRRFVAEARLASAIDHPNVIPIYAFGEEHGRLYLAMRYVDGGVDLRKRLIERRRLAPAEAVHLLDQLARALDAVHRAGLVHRDVKPDNVLLARSGDGAHSHVYLADFGLTRSSAYSGVTDAGRVVGTISYASPEQIRGDEVGVASDVYSFGCVAFECLSGERPFLRDNDPALMYAHLHEPPPGVTERCPDLPTELDDVFARALAKPAEDRFASCGEVATAIASAFGGVAPVDDLDTPTVVRRLPTGSAILGGGGVSVGGGGQGGAIQELPMSAPGLAGPGRDDVGDADVATVVRNRVGGTGEPGHNRLDHDGPDHDGARSRRPPSAPPPPPARPVRRVRRAVGVAVAMVVVAVAAAGVVVRTRSSDGETPVPVADEGPVAGGFQHVDVGSVPASLNPAAGIWTAGDLVVASAVYDNLVVTTPDGGYAPFLARSITPDADAMVWTIGLPSGVTFTDAARTPLDAAAVVHDLEAVRAQPALAAMLAPVASITAADPATVVVTMSTPWPWFPYTLAGQAGYIAAPTTIDGTPADVPIGTGPFVATTWTPGRTLAGDRNPAYWRPGRPYLDAVEIAAVDRATDRATRADDDLVVVPQSVADDVRGAPTIRAYGSTAWGLVFNTAKPPFDDAGARRAVADAVDIGRLATSYGGAGGDVTVVASPLAPPADGPPDGDPAPSTTEPASGGQPAGFTLLAPTQGAAIAAHLAEQWKAAGAEVTTASGNRPYQERLTTGDFDVALVAVPVPVSPDELLALLHGGPGATRPAAGVSVPNPSRLATTPDDQALDDARGQHDPAAVRAAYEAAIGSQRADAVYVWLFQEPDDLVANRTTGLGNVTPGGPVFAEIGKQSG